MLNLEDALYVPKKEDILSKISELDIFRMYCSPFKEIDKSFCSELRDDHKPDCRIFLTSGNEFKYKDFATGECLSCFQYIMKKYSVNYGECLKIIINDFKLGVIKTNIDPNFLIGKLEIRVKQPILIQKAEIQIVSQSFNLVDHSYWSQYGISLEMLEEYNVFSSRFVYLNKNDKRTIFEYNKKNPMYAYRFTRDGKYYYKIYWPKGEKGFKWLFSGGAAEDVEGYDQLRLTSDLLVITKSLKDCMAFRLCNIDAISLQGEANKLEFSFLEKLKKRFERIVVVYDNDEQGIKGAKGLRQQYGLDYFVLEEAKDLSDLIKLKGLEYAKENIRKIII